MVSVASRPAEPDPGRRHLRADCARCVGLCCVAPAFAASADFAIDKPARQPCPHLGGDFRCTIHDGLRSRGFPGCDVYDCFGAGQKVTQLTFGGRDWRGPGGAAMLAVFPVVRQLHELLWYLAEASALPAAGALREELGRARDETDRLSRQTAEFLLELDVAAHRDTVNVLLVRASEMARAASGHRGVDRRGADLIGARLRGADLRGANLRGAYLVGADLRRADLGVADVTGADLRGADVRGAALADTLFLTQPQLTAAKGDTATTVPPSLRRPSWWPSGV